MVQVKVYKIKRDAENKINIQKQSRNRIASIVEYCRPNTGTWYRLPMTTVGSVLNLVEAYEALKRGCQNPVDILGLVSYVSWSIDSQRCHIWLLDESLISSNTVPSDNTDSNGNNSTYTTARIELYRSVDVSRVEEQQIQPGDILRLNRVVLKASEKKNICNGSLIFQFCSHNPEPGLNWYRLAEKNGDGVTIGKVRGIKIPHNMVTPRQRITALIDWYNKHYNHFQGGDFYATPSKGFDIDDTCMGRSTRLTSLPCRERKLNEIRSSVGLTSNIEVRVTRFYSKPARELITKSMYRKRRKFADILPSLVAFAVITDDDSDTFMIFVDISGRFSSLLELAKKEKTNIKLTNVLTKHQSDLRGLQFPSNDIVLVPTTTTAGFLVCESERDTNDETKKIQKLDKQNVPGEEVGLISGVQDIHIDGISLKKKCFDSYTTVFSTTTEYLETILDEGKHFKTARIFFDDQKKGMAIAIPEVVKCLCGSLDIDELLNDNTLLRYSMRLFRAVILEKIMLKWTIYTDHNNERKISNVALHQLPK